MCEIRCTAVVGNLLHKIPGFTRIPSGTNKGFDASVICYDKFYSQLS